MGLISTTRTIMYCMAAVVTTGCVGFTVNAYILYLLRENVKRLELEITALRRELTQVDGDVTRSSRDVTRSSRDVTRDRASDSESEDEFQLALESIPSQSIIAQGTDSLCTDRQCESGLLTLCQSIDKDHDTLKLTEQGCEQGLTTLTQLNDQTPDTPQLMWRLARIMYEKAKHNTKAGVNAQKGLLEALAIAKKGEELSEGNSKSHLWYAILLGDTCKYDDTRVKLTKGLEFEKQVKLSLDIDPYNSTALHLIGRYCFEVSGIKWWEAKIAATLFGCVPQSTYDEALQYFLRADEINSEWMENSLFIAKCLIALKRNEEAKSWLDRVDLKQGAEHELQAQITDLKKKL
ncbi:regulator of microtubule dynamics protein 1-like [Bolinopsis microptera]|uniref:regulator of microtubule dynamics protein 1-like n=1 Tax=Bolinopsis microptera TaxID=2820187 RepID=UPI003078F9BD